MKILVTGGAGYIGSHTILTLLRRGIKVVVLDNLSNSSSTAMARVGVLAGAEPIFVYGDVRDRALLKRIFSEHQFEAVIHFAGLKAVGDSVTQPLRYYDNNLNLTLALLSEMFDAGVRSLVFSSSATVYGQSAVMPVSEQSPVGSPSNPYGRTKLMAEEILSDLALADQKWRFAILRYFNPVGAHESGLIGEDPKGVPNNLLPYITQVAIGKLRELSVFGGDYPTADGTGVRDYIHVLDLADGHLQALEALRFRSGAHVWNLGTGQGHSVLDVIRTFETVTGQTIPYRVQSRRPGDIATCYADPAKAESELGWRANRSLSEMIRDAWNWQCKNPNGYS